MKNVLVIGRKDVGEKNDAFLLASAISKYASSLKVNAAYFEDFIICSTNDGSRALFYEDETLSDLTQYDVVIMINWSHRRLYTDLAHSIAYIADKAGKQVWNKELITARSSTKLSQIVRLSYEDIEIPETCFALQTGLVEKMNLLPALPFVMKDPESSRGRDNHFCETLDEYTRLSWEDRSYVIQQFIPNDKSDLRMFVAGGEVGVVIRRQGATGTHLNNLSQGGKSELVNMSELPESLINATKRIAKHFKRDLCGIDFMQNNRTGTYIFLEINTTPQIVNGVYADEKAATITQALERK